MKPGVFIIDAPGANRIRKLRSKFRREIVEEIASRCRYADRLADLQDELGEEDESLLALARRDERDAFGQTALHRAASEVRLYPPLPVSSTCCVPLYHTVSLTSMQ